MSYKNIGFSLVVAGLIMTGCAEPKPVHHESLSLDKVERDESVKKIDKTVIVLKPALTLMDSKNAKRSDLQSQISRMRAGLTGGDYNFNDAYEYKYGATAGNAFKNDISDILRNQGFTVVEEYESYDDIDFSVRKSAYLVIQPEIEASFITSNVKQERSGDTITEHGTVSLVGTVKIIDLEPLSKERISSKKITLGDLRINENYTSIRKTNSGGSGNSAFDLGKKLGSSIGEAIFGTSEHDTTENTLVKIVNKVHSHIVDKTKPRLQQGVLLAYQKDIEEIKTKKRY